MGVKAKKYRQGAGIKPLRFASGTKTKNAAVSCGASLCSGSQD